MCGGVAFAPTAVDFVSPAAAAACVMRRVRVVSQGMTGYPLEVQRLLIEGGMARVRDLPQHGLSSNKDDGPDHLGLRYNALQSASNGPNHLGLLCANQGIKVDTSLVYCHYSLNDTTLLDGPMSKGDGSFLDFLDRNGPRQPGPLCWRIVHI